MPPAVPADEKVDGGDRRQQAGAVLAAELVKAGIRPAVLGAVTAMAVPVARPVAAALQVPVVLVLARTLAVPHCPGDPFGALDEDGHCVLDYTAVAGLRLDTAEITTAKELVLPELTLERAVYAGPALGAFLPAKCVLLVQGAMEHGLLMEAAVEQALRHGAEEVVVGSVWATPAAASRFLGRDGVKLVCPWISDGPPPDSVPTEEGRPHPQPQVAAWMASHVALVPTPRRRATDRLPARA
jgi:putative phosphoribosyl transferase